MKALFVTFVLVLVTISCAQEPSAAAGWPFVGSDQAHTKYSAAEEITASNVGELEVAWKWEPKETPLEEYDTQPGPFQATPIMVNGILYLSTMYTRVAALDAKTGAERWTFDPRAYEGGPVGAGPTGFKHRGIAYWSDGKHARIFLNSRDRLYAIDAATGELDSDFGESGSVALTDGHGREVSRFEFDQTSPPVVFEDLVIVGSRIPDGVQREFDPPGTVQAFDVRTGEQKWVFFTIPQSSDDFGADTWEDESWRITGHANVWGLMSLDTERGLLYVPTSTPSSDYWGGRRKGANLFAESLVCLDAHTGERKWHFQTVYHGLWDYDLSAAPNLVTITVDGREIDAVAQVAKSGFTYVFDRVTGEPVWPIEERAVDTVTDVPGEELYPTQPFPTKPPPFARQGVTLEDANDLTPEIHALAVAEMKRFRLGPLFTPPSLRGRSSALVRAAAQTGVGRPSTRKPASCTFGRRRTRIRTRSARIRATTCAWTSSTATTARMVRLLSCTGRPAGLGRRRPLRVNSIRFRSPSRPAHTWWRLTSTRARSSGRRRSGKGAMRSARTLCLAELTCLSVWARSATPVHW